MTPQTARCYITALACMARIEGMKAANAYRDRRQESQAYGEDAFAFEAQQLEVLSIEVINQGTPD